jgi:hypothetical protein
MTGPVTSERVEKSALVFLEALNLDKMRINRENPIGGTRHFCLTLGGANFSEKLGFV